MERDRIKVEACNIEAETTVLNFNGNIPAKCFYFLTGTVFGNLNLSLVGPLSTGLPEPRYP